MKIIYSQLKELVPDLTVPAKDVSEVFTMLGYLCDGFSEITYKGTKDYILSLEIRQNRPDCLSILGLAKEISVYYNLKLNKPSCKNYPIDKDDNLISVLDKNCVRRILSIEISNVINGNSPQWLREFLSLYEINSINALVDISNYVLLVTGQPSHIFDRDKIDGNLTWRLNKGKYDSIKTLDETIVILKKNSLIIEDQKKVLAIAGLIGSYDSRTTENSKNIIVETAIYDNTLIRKNSKDLNIITEASRRLEKELDPNNSDYILDILISMILDICGGKLTSHKHNFYENKQLYPAISFDPQSPSQIAGVEIPNKFVERIVVSLGCQITKNQTNNWLIIPPLGRLDLKIPEDIIEEVIRFYGFYKIPSNEISAIKIIEEITPPSIKIEEKTRDILSFGGYDEILSWSLLELGKNEESNYKKWQVIKTENTVNENYPELRQSMFTGLYNQYVTYKKNNVDNVSLFEIGNVFGYEYNKYLENKVVGIFLCLENPFSSVNSIKRDLDILLRTLGLNNITYTRALIIPPVANALSCWNINIENREIGIVYKVADKTSAGKIYFAELNLSCITEILQHTNNYSVSEIKQKLIKLDTNILIKKEESIDKIVLKLKKIVGEYLWDIEIIDGYQLNSENIKYTIRVLYKNLTDEKAKSFNNKALAPYAYKP